MSGRWRVWIAVAACAATLACGDAPPEPATEPALPEAPAPAAPEEPAPPALVEPPAAVPAPAPAPSPEPPAAEAPPPAPSPEPAQPEPPPPISLEELGQRIKATPAIGTFSKLALKNDIDDLIDALRRYHENKEGDLDALHTRYEALVLKLMTLLEQEEPELALALGRSRQAIWSRLVNPVEFAKLPA
jgi:hypothetical protein